MIQVASNHSDGVRQKLLLKSEYHNLHYKVGNQHMVAHLSSDSLQNVMRLIINVNVSGYKC